MATARKKTTAWTRLLKAKGRECRGGSKANTRKAANAYIKDAVKKGKSKTTATASANKVLNRSCKTAVGKPKRKTARRKTARRR